MNAKPMVELTTAQRNLLAQCDLAIDGTICRTARNRPSSEVLARHGLVTIRSFGPPTWAHAHRPRSYVISITTAGREAIQ